MKPARTATDKEARRRLAVDKVTAGWSQKDVADFLGVHPVTVNKWVRAYRAAGAELIRRKLGVAYHPNYLREWMTRRDLTPQKPAKRARERNPPAIDRWLAEAWPAIQKKRPTSGPTSS